MASIMPSLCRKISPSDHDDYIMNRITNSFFTANTVDFRCTQLTLILCVFRHSSSTSDNKALQGLVKKSEKQNTDCQGLTASDQTLPARQSMTTSWGCDASVHFLDLHLYLALSYTNIHELVPPVTDSLPKRSTMRPPYPLKYFESQLVSYSRTIRLTTGSKFDFVLLRR